MSWADVGMGAWAMLFADAGMSYGIGSRILCTTNMDDDRAASCLLAIPDGAITGVCLKTSCMYSLGCQPAEAHREPT